MDIGLLNEKALHAALKEWYARPGDQIEVKVDGYFIDIVQGLREIREIQTGYGNEGQAQPEGLLVEIQTRNFSAIKRKIIDLTARHPLRLVHPIARDKWIIKPAQAEGKRAERRKSPKRGQVVDVFRELVSFPALLNEPNFSLEVLLIQEDEVRRYDSRKGWRRRGWVIEERHLVAVLERHLFQEPADLWRLMPEGLPATFTTTDLTRLMKIPIRIAGQIAYCLREMDLIEQIGKRGRSYLYTLK
jgi:hypothetical protein